MGKPNGPVTYTATYIVSVNGTEVKKSESNLTKAGAISWLQWLNANIGTTGLFAGYPEDATYGIKLLIKDSTGKDRYKSSGITGKTKNGMARVWSKKYHDYEKKFGSNLT